MSKLLPLRIKPGIDREYTSFTNEGGWRDCDKIRFRQGLPETIGGWTRLPQVNAFDGICRLLYDYANLEADQIVALATQWKFYLFYQGSLNDITPIRDTTAAGDVTFSATNGDATITVSDTAHGAVADDFVTFSGAASLGGNITADVLNQEYQITVIVDADSYEIEAKDTSGNTVTANASDTGNGGANVVGEYQINTGLADVVFGAGWGVGPWGGGTFGTPRDSGVATNQIRLWSADNFGEDLIFNVKNGGIYYWDVTTGATTRAVSLDTLSGASDVPSIASYVMVSDQDRHVIAMGADPFTNPGTQDPLLIRWSDQENAADWTPRTTNTAGDLRLSSGSFIVGAIQTKREIVIFTDKSLHSMQFLGPPYTFGIQEIGLSGRAVSQNAIIAIDDIVYWMEEGRFMVYDGTIRELPCRVKEFVFSNINAQFAKTYAGHNPRFSEIWWFYPSGDDGSDPEENDRYVVYNYEQNVWYFGTMSRTAWVANSFGDNPISADRDGFMYYQESGQEDSTNNPPTAVEAWIESSPIDIEDGDNFVFLDRVIPDITFRASEATSPSVKITMKAHDFPGAPFNQSQENTITKTSSSPTEQYTNQVFVRLRGRAFTIRVENENINVSWRLGTPRIGIRPDGRR